MSRNTRSLDRPERAGINSEVKFVPIEIIGRSSIEVDLPNVVRVAVPGHNFEAIGAVIAALLSERAPRAGDHWTWDAHG